MENRNPGKPILPLALVFVVTILFSVIARSWLLARWNMDYLVLLAGNGILFLATAFSFFLYSRSLKNSNPHVFVRMLYSSMLVKMVFCLGATFLYLFLAGKEVNKPGIMGCFVLYVVYTYIEVKVLMRLSKKVPKNA